MFHGEGSNGKTTVLEAVGKVLKSYVHHLPIAVLMDASNGYSAGKASPELAQSAHSRILFFSESNEGDYFNEGKIKMLTVRQLYCEPFEFKPVFKMIFDTNHLPKIRGNDFAIWRRLKVIPFTQTFKGTSVDKYLPQKLQSQAEQEAIFSWIVEGAMLYYQQGLEDVPSVVEATQGYREQVESVLPFIRTCVELDADCSCNASELYAAYTQFCIDNNLDAESMTSFGRVLKSNGYQKKRVATGMIYQGLKLKNV